MGAGGYADGMAAILVIEDDGATAAAIIAELKQHGHEVTHASDGDAGLELATREAFDAITLDRMLPGLDGLSLVARLRERHITIPVLMLSALSDVDERIAGLRAGGDDYLTKPFDFAEMAMRVEVLVWGYYFDPGANLISVHIARLRKKIDRPDRSSPIQTVKGEGYLFDGG